MRLTDLSVFFSAAAAVVFFFVAAAFLAAAAVFFFVRGGGGGFLFCGGGFFSGSSGFFRGGGGVFLFCGGGFLVCGGGLSFSAHVPYPFAGYVLGQRNTFSHKLGVHVIVLEEVINFGGHRPLKLFHQHPVGAGVMVHPRHQVLLKVRHRAPDMFA